MKHIFLWLLGALFVSTIPQAYPADTIFSGPQPGERTTGFRVAPIEGTISSTDRDPIAENQGKPAALVFLHALERSLVPLLRVVDEYGSQRKEHLRTEIIFLASDRIEGANRIKAAKNSLRLKSSVGLSLDGLEGPGNYGLNKECMMTIVVAKEDRVTDSFALVQPGIADAPKVLAALAKASGDTNPPTAEALLAKGQNDTRRAGTSRGQGEMRQEGKDPFPGAVPTDEKLTGLLRRFIRPTNDDATVDQVLEEVTSYIKDDPALKKQAIDGWIRILHFQDRYGTAYARKAGAAFLQKLQKEIAAPPASAQP